MKKPIAILSAILITSLICTAFAVLTGIYTIPNTGTLRTDLQLAAYEDVDCTIPCTNITWGNIEPNVKNYKTLYVKNLNTVPISISSHTENWNPAELADYVTFSGTLYSSPNLASGESNMFNIQLTINGTYTGEPDFAFDIVITGTEIVP